MKKIIFGTASAIAILAAGFAANAGTPDVSRMLGMSKIFGNGLPDSVASLPQAQAPKFNGIVIPGGRSFEDIYKTTFTNIYNRAKMAGKEQAVIAVSKDSTKINSGVRWYGNPKAKVKIMELESLTCTHCAVFAKDIFPDFKKNYIDTGKVYYGIGQLASDRVSVTATILAGSLNDRQYLDYTKAIYSNQYKFFQGNIQKAGDVLKNVSAMAGIPAAKFDAAWNNNSLGERIFLQSMGYGAYYTEAMHINNLGTPFFVGQNGTQYNYNLGGEPKEFAAFVEATEKGTPFPEKKPDGDTASLLRTKQ